MKKIIYPARYCQGVILFFLFFIIVFTSPVFAQDLENKTDQNLVFSATVLAITAKTSSEQMSISYNGLSTGSGMIFPSYKKPVGLEPPDLPYAVVNGLDKEKIPFKFDRKLKQMTHYFFKYFNVDDCSTEDEDSKVLLKGNTRLMNFNQMDPDNFEFNLSFNVGYDDDTILRMNAINLVSYWRHTFVNAVYHPEKKEFEFGLSSAYINDCLLTGMKLEFKANPVAGSGAVLLTMNL